MLVEDNPSDEKLTKRALGSVTNTSYHVQHVTRLAAALERLATGDFDVALVDLSLPDSSGLDTFQTLTAAAPAVPIVVLTGVDDEQLAMGLLQHGAQDYLCKQDVEPKLLARSIRYAIERNRATALESLNQQLEQAKSSLTSALRQLEGTNGDLAEAQTVLQKQNRRLKRLYRTAHRFVDNVSHEFRTPLTVIKEYGSLLRDGVLGNMNGEQRRFLDVISDRSDDLNRMVDDMLDVSKLGTGILGVNRASCRAQDVIERVLPGLERKASLKQVTLETTIGTDLPQIYADPENIGRVLVNLVVNAIKFCGDPGVVHVEVAAKADGAEVEFSVSDNGGGIREEDMKKIFRRFKQLGGADRSSTRGFGLGLSIVRELVDLNLGRMHVASEPGIGSTFSFTLSSAHPAEIVRRQLSRLQRLRRGQLQVCLVSAHVDLYAQDNERNDLDAILVSVLRRDDLLFRCGSDWTLVLPRTRSDVGRLFHRIQRALEEANRNRPGAPLPRIEFSQHGFWNIPDQAKSFLMELDKTYPAGVSV